MSTTADELLASERNLTAKLVTREEIMEKLIEHDNELLSSADKLALIQQDIAALKEAVAPVLLGIASSIFAFKTLMYVGAAAAATVGIIELLEHVNGAAHL